MAAKPKSKPKGQGAGKRRFIALARRFTGVVMGGVAFAYAGLFVFGMFFADDLIFPAPRAGYAVTMPGLVKLPLSGGGEAAALWLPKRGATTAILHLHGNAEDLGTIRAGLEELRVLTGCAVLAVDYPGYGLSPGKPSETGTLRAADAAFDHLVSVRGFAPENIVVWGRSLGTGPAVDLAARRHVRGVILEAPFTSTFRTVTKVKLLPFDRFDSLAKIDRVQSPLLVIHGERDEVVPFEHGRELVDAAQNAPVRKFLPILGAGHNGLLSHANPEQRAEVMKFIGGRSE